MQLGLAPTEHYQSQLNTKVAQTQTQFAHLFDGELEVFSSPPKHFRMRAEFKIWHDKTTGLAQYAMHLPGERNKPVVIESFDIGSETITRLMPLLLQNINSSENLRKKLFQVEFLTSTTGEAVLSLIYHRPLDDAWQQLAEQLASYLGCNIIGRSRKQKRTVGNDFVTECLLVQGRQTFYQQVETGFTQPNAVVCVAMLEWACKQIEGIGKDLLELYCGNGNFTIPLSKHFRQVLATEVSKNSVKSAQTNIAQNQVENITIARLSSEEFTQAINGVREFRRLKDIDLHSYDFSTIFVDPPRAGLDKGTISLAARFDTIIYISCNPTTLLNNLEALVDTHTVEHLALFDQFPYTEHRECGVVLKKRD